MTKVLLLSASFGDGHRQAANALRESFRRRNVTVHEVDCFQETNKWLAGISQWTYETTTKYLPGLYGAVFRLTSKIDSNSVYWKIVSLSSRRALVAAVKQFRPDVVLQLFPDHAAESVSRLDGKPYLGVVITDFSVHSHWFHSQVDTYFIANAGLAESMEPFVARTSEIVDSGIPIRSQFKNANRSLTASKPYVLLATGGRGVFPDLHQVLMVLLQQLPELDVYVLCGRNEDMLHKIQELAASNPRLHGLSYVDNVATWFQNASFAVVKSGGITVSECLTASCPMMFYRPQPGQEMDNATFLEEMGAGIVVQRYDELRQLLEEADFMTEITFMKQACKRLARPDAAEQIVQHVLDHIERDSTPYEEHVQMDAAGR